MQDYTFDEIKLGMICSFKKEINKKQMDEFLAITGDNNPLHLDKNYAIENGFKNKVVYGFLVNSFCSTLAGIYLPGKYSLILSNSANFKNPCFEGDLLTITGEVTNKIESNKIIILKTDIKNQDGKIILEGKLHIQVLK